MSAEIHCTLTGTVLKRWEQITPQGNSRPYHQMKIRLDDKSYSGKTFGGRDVQIRSYDRADYLTQAMDGQRVFVSGTVQAQAYESKKTQKPAAYLMVIAKVVSVEGQTSAPAAPTDSEEEPPASGPTPF